MRERSFGQWEGRPFEEYEKKFHNLLANFRTLSRKEQKELKLEPDIESDDEVVDRFIVQLREIAIAYPDKTVLVATHGGCIRSFLMHLGYIKLEDLPAGPLISNAGYAKILSDGIDFFVEEVNGINKK